MLRYDIMKKGFATQTKLLKKGAIMTKEGLKEFFESSVLSAKQVTPNIQEADLNNLLVIFACHRLPECKQMSIVRKNALTGEETNWLLLSIDGVFMDTTGEYCESDLTAGKHPYMMATKNKNICPDILHVKGGLDPLTVLPDALHPFAVKSMLMGAIAEIIKAMPGDGEDSPEMEYPTEAFVDEQLRKKKAAMRQKVDAE